MKKRFSVCSIILTAALSVLVTLGAAALAAWLLLGQAGLTIASGAAYIHTRFVGEYDASAMADAALDAMVDSLGDRWSYYMDQESYEAQQLRRSNAYVGIGVTVTYEQDGLHIQSVSEGGPAQEAGLLAGEVITAVDGTDVTGDNASQGSALIQGEEGAQVVLTVLNADGEKRQVTVQRARLHTTSVSSELLEDGVGYVAIANFYSGCADQAKQAVDELLEQGAASLLFDVRDDPGGYLDELTDLLDYLLPEGTIFRSGDRSGPNKTVTSDADCVDLPMAVLVNENTYSAAELFAAQLQESVGAVIVGQPTFGKGYSQQTLTLFGGGALNLSTKTYYTGSGVSLIGAGVTLDIEVAQTGAGDAQLAAAVEYLTGE
jgi:carboxyl-terminal processing protease